MRVDPGAPFLWTCAPRADRCSGGWGGDHGPGSSGPVCPVAPAPAARRHSGGPPLLLFPAAGEGEPKEAQRKAQLIPYKGAGYLAAFGDCGARFAPAGAGSGR